MDKNNNMKLIKYHRMYLLVLLFGIISTSSSAQTLDEYLQIAAENNPELRSAYAQFEASMQKAPQVASLENPTLTMSAFGLQMIETRVGSQMARFQLMQMFPWFGTLKAKEDAANLMAEAAFQEYLDMRNQVFFEVKSVYAELYALEKIIRFKEENLKILDSYRELAISRFKSGNAPMVNVVKVDIQKDAAVTEIELLQDQKKPLQTEFNLMLRREPGMEIAVQDTIILGDFERLIPPNEVFENHPSVTRLEKEKRAYEMEETVAQKEGLPMLGLGIDYAVIAKRTDANPEMNGRDAIMPMVSVTLPIFRKKYKAARREAEFMGQSIDQRQQTQKNELQNNYEMTVYELTRAEKLVSLYERQLENSVQARKLLLSGFSNSINDFDEVLEINQDILMYQTQKIEAVKAGIIAEARLKYLFSKTE